MSLVEEILREDAKYRDEGLKEGTDLLSVETIVVSPKGWDFCAPTITKGSGKDVSARVLETDPAKIIRELSKERPRLAEVAKSAPEILDNVVVAGGSVSRLVSPPETNRRGDVDLFVFGLDRDAADRKIREVFEALMEADRRIARQKFEELLARRISECLQQASQKETGKRTTQAARIREWLGAEGVGHPPERFAKIVEEKIKEIRMENGKLANAADKELCKALYLDFPRGSRPKQFRADKCATLVFEESEGEVYQFVLRLYASVSEVLHGFDLGCSAVGLYLGAAPEPGLPSRCVTTGLGRAAFAYGVNIVDTTRRSTTYERRLKKYFGRGFDIVLPELDIGQLPRRNFRFNMPEVCHLPFLPFSYERLDGNRIGLETFLGREDGPQTDYGPEEFTEFTAGYRNLYKLLRGETDLYHFAEDSSRLEIFSGLPHMNTKMIHWFYDQFQDSLFHDGRLNLTTLRHYFPGENPAAFVKELLGAEGVEGAKEVVAELCARYRRFALDAFAKIEKLDGSKIPWVTKNPGSQLTGSFNPIFEDPGKWYGGYLRPRSE